MAAGSIVGQQEVLKWQQEILGWQQEVAAVALVFVCVLDLV